MPRAQPKITPQEHADDLKWMIANGGFDRVPLRDLFEKHGMPNHSLAWWTGYLSMTRVFKTGFAPLAFAKDIRQRRNRIAYQRNRRANQRSKAA